MVERVGVLVALSLAAALAAAAPLRADVGTAEDRAALFDDLLAKTQKREALSPVKNRILGLDVLKEMRRFRDEVVAARTDEELYFALAKVSNARKDRHLKLTLVPGGLRVEGLSVPEDNYPVPDAVTPRAAVRLATDYGTPGAYFLFVADRGTSSAAKVALGDKVVSVNGEPIDAYRKAIEPYHRYSTVYGFWDKLAFWLPQESPYYPRKFYRETLVLGLQRKDGTRYTADLPYVAPSTIQWEGNGARRYPGFKLLFDTDTYELHRHDSKRVLVVAWHAFGPNLAPDVDRLIAYAGENGLLDYDIVWDGTRSRGGSKGAYAVQRLQPRPFKTTFGNLRLSDITQAFVDAQRERIRKRQLTDKGNTETMDGGRDLLAWLEDDVLKGLAAGQDYTNDVPFKLAHLPKYSDGIVKPAPVHFRGRLVCLFGPFGGSHLDQFAAIVADNDLGHSIGMPTGGYSNTWEWEETLVLPSSQKPVVRFMWNIGHTVRPNGQILEGEAAAIQEPLPQTRDNYGQYYPLLMERAFRHLGLQ